VCLTRPRKILIFSTFSKIDNVYNDTVGLFETTTFVSDVNLSALKNK